MVGPRSVRRRGPGKRKVPLVPVIVGFISSGLPKRKCMTFCVLLRVVVCSFCVNLLIYSCA
jgi:hypothetical protein